MFLSHTTNYLDIHSLTSSGLVKQDSLFVSAGQLLFCGPAAVTIFFVISGLCIHAPNLNKDKLNIFDFYTRRFVRIGIPLVCAYGIKYILIGGFSFEPLPVWSLWCEMFYYLLYPFIMWLIFRFGFIPCFFLTLIASITLALSPDTHDGFAWTYGPFLSWILFLPVWLLGVLVAENIKRTAFLPTVFRKSVVLYLSAVALVFLALISTVLEFHLHRLITYKFTMILYGLPAAMFVFLLLAKDSGKSVVVRFLDRQGAWSYSLYLMHPIGVTIAFDTLLCLHIEHFDQSLSLIVFGFVLVTGILTSLLFFYLCEKPSHLIAKRLASRIGLVAYGRMKFQKIKYV